MLLRHAQTLVGSSSPESAKKRKIFTYRATGQNVRKHMFENLRAFGLVSTFPDTTNLRDMDNNPQQGGSISDRGRAR